MHGPRSSYFVGRNAELEALRSCWEEATQGIGQVVTVTGEAGIGKTRLVEVFAEWVEDQGAVVLKGRWYESREMPPYVGFSEALGQLARLTEVAETLHQDPYVLEACRLVPGFSGVAESPPFASTAPGLHHEYRLWEGVARILAVGAGASPLVVFLDDLHWMDRASASLLAYLGGRSREQTILILGAYRDGEVQPGHPLLEALAELRREGVLSSIALGGLSLDEVAALTVALTQADVATHPRGAGGRGGG